jgi:HD-like signal output (HDOD) protein/CheY-like chemotaxis protein
MRLESMPEGTLVLSGIGLDGRESCDEGGHATVTTILFVDDEPRILSALARMLRSQHDWEVMLASSAEEGLRAADAANLDAVVSDVRMPGMDGISFLSEMRRRHPQVARIVLSGQVEHEMAMRCVNVAHQSLVKPCEGAALVAAVNRACELQGRLYSPEIKRLVGRIGSLPSPPALVSELHALLDRSDIDLDAVNHLVSSDVAMSAKILQLVNSAFFGLAHEITSVRRALNYLGLELVRDLAVAAGIFQAAETSGREAAMLIGEVQAHSAVVAQLATELSSGQEFAQQAFVAGLLHDAGWLVFASQAPELLREYLAARQSGLSSGIEAEVLSSSHADVGAYLLSLWGIPPAIVDAVARHEDVDLASQRLDLALVVRTADWAAEHAGSGLATLEQASPEPNLDFPEGAVIRARLGFPAPPSCSPAEVLAGQGPANELGVTA